MCSYPVNTLCDTRVRTRKRGEPTVTFAKGGKEDKTDENQERSPQNEVGNLHVPVARLWTLMSNMVQSLCEAKDELLSLMDSDIFLARRFPLFFSKHTDTSQGPQHILSSTSTLVPRPSTDSALQSLRSLYSKNCIKTTATACATTSQGIKGREEKTPSLQRVVAGENCAPVAFVMNLNFEHVRSTLYSYTQQTGLESIRPAVAPTLRKREVIGVSPDGCTPCIGGHHHRGTRICRASRFADLLRAEANELRERRLAVDAAFLSPAEKPSWS